MRCFICIFFSIGASTGFAVTNLEIKKDCKECEVTFHVTATKFMSFDMEGGKPTGKLKENKGKVTGEITVPWVDFHTSIEGRTNHMREIFQTEKYPNVILKIKNLPSTDGDHEFKGDLYLVGKYKPVKGKYTVKTDGAKRKFRAEFDVDFTQWGIEEPEIAGTVKVKTPVNVTVDGVASP